MRNYFFVAPLTSLARLVAATRQADALARRLELRSLPQCVQEAILDQVKGAEIETINRETEYKKTRYKVETILHGKHRNFAIDTNGVVLFMEEETTVDSLPASARAAVLKEVAGGTLGIVELLKSDRETIYKAAYTSKRGKKHELLVRPDGTEAR